MYTYTFAFNIQTDTAAV